MIYSWSERSGSNAAVTASTALTDELSDQSRRASVRPSGFNQDSYDWVVLVYPRALTPESGHGVDLYHRLAEYLDLDFRLDPSRPERAEKAWVQSNCFIYCQQYD